jgi:hypothetical protein
VHDLNWRRVRHLRSATHPSGGMTRRLVAPPWQVQEIEWRVRPKGDFETLLWGVVCSNVATCFADESRDTGKGLVWAAPMPTPER